MGSKIIKSFFSNFSFKGHTKYYPTLFTIIFVTILTQYSFLSLETFFYDLWVRVDYVMRPSDHIVLIKFDEKSDEYLGERFPYTYSTANKFIKNLIKDRPMIINYFVGLRDPVTAIEEEALLQFKQNVFSYTSQGGVFRFGTDMDSWGEILPPRGLRELGYSLALIHIDSQFDAKDDVCRKAILNISGEDSLHVWTANQYLLQKERPQLNLNRINGAFYRAIADATFARFRYASNPTIEANKVRSIDFHRVVVGQYPKNYFKDKIVLVGPSYATRFSDFVKTPFNRNGVKRVPNLNVHAQIIEALLQGKTVVEAHKNWSIFGSYIIGIILSLIISQVRPSIGLFLTVLSMLSLLIVGHILFSYFNIWIHLAHLVLTVFIVYYIWIPFRAMAEYQTRYAIEKESKMLKQVDHLKQNFINLMSHDLKTPVAKIVGISENLLNGLPKAGEQRKMVEKIIHVTGELNNFITTILDLTKIEGKNLKLNIISKDINEIVEMVSEDYRELALRKNIQLRTELGSLYPIMIDVELMKRVLSNLLENAIKYSFPKTQVTLKTWDDQYWVYIQVKDEGPGMGEEEIKYIFEKFYRVKNDSYHKVKGSGLGLYLVRYFVELHGGQVMVDSRPDMGSSFTVKLKNS